MGAVLLVRFEKVLYLPPWRVADLGDRLRQEPMSGPLRGTGVMSAAAPGGVETGKTVMVDPCSPSHELQEPQDLPHQVQGASGQAQGRGQVQGALLARIEWRPRSPSSPQSAESLEYRVKGDRIEEWASAIGANGAREHRRGCIRVLRLKLAGRMQRGDAGIWRMGVSR